MITRDQSGASVPGLLKGHTEKIISVSFSANSDQIMSCSLDGTVRVWDTKTGALEGLYSGCTSSSLILKLHNSTLSVSGFHPGRSEQTKVGAVTMSPPPEEALKRIRIEDGWVKRGNELLLWVPNEIQQHLYGITAAVVQECVDWETLSMYSGTNWTKIYDTNEGHHFLSPSSFSSSAPASSSA